MNTLLRRERKTARRCGGTNGERCIGSTRGPSFGERREGPRLRRVELAQAARAYRLCAHPLRGAVYAITDTGRQALELHRLMEEE